MEGLLCALFWYGVFVILAGAGEMSGSQNRDDGKNNSDGSPDGQGKKDGCARTLFADEKKD